MTTPTDLTKPHEFSYWDSGRDGKNYCCCGLPEDSPLHIQTTPTKNEYWNSNCPYGNPDCKECGKQKHTMTTPTVNKPAAVIKTKEFSVSEMTGSASDNFGFSFENWKEHHLNVEIISVTPFQQTYVETKFLVMYSELEKDSSL